MNVSIPFVRRRAALFAKVLGCALLLSGFQLRSVAQTYDVTLYVDTAGNDNNPGTSASPLRTVQKAADMAVTNKQNQLSTRVLIRPGTYREFVDLTRRTNWPTNDPTNAERMTFEGTDANNPAVISGADVYTGWTQQGNLYTHSWNYDWGPYVAPWQQTTEALTEIVLRREMVYVNDSRLDPVMTFGELAPGTFFVDEAADLLYVYPPANVNFGSAFVEVAIRESAWDSQYEYNLTVKNLRFEKTTDAWDNARGQFTAGDVDNLLMENVEFRYANWTGAYIGESKNVTVRNMIANDNGGRGFAMWRIIGLNMRDSQSLRNNWRGWLGGFIGWTVGNNIESSHNVQLINHDASDNFCRGLWFDTDVVNAVIDNATLNNNRYDGILFEAVQGPVTLKNSEIRNNDRYGILGGMVENLTLDRNVFEDNGQASIVVSGANEGRGVSNFETGVYQTVLTRNWTMYFNQFVGNGPYLIGTTVNSTRWSEFINSLSSNNNLWCDDTKPNVFRRDGGVLMTFAQWQSYTGEEATSAYCSEVLPVELAAFDAVSDEGSVVLRWSTLSESNNAGFRVERDIAGSFESIGFVNGNGTTTSRSDYSFRVSDLAQGTHRFRLTQVDADGSEWHSQVVEAVIGIDQLYVLSDVYPNPIAVDGTLQIAVRDEQRLTVEVFDLLGKRVATVLDTPVSAGSRREVSIDASGLANGTYLVRVSGDNFRQTRKLMVVR